jgi:gliding motility-associated-like protein
MVFMKRFLFVYLFSVLSLSLFGQTKCDLPNMPSPISGNMSVCQQSIEVYSVPFQNDVSYTWNFPTDWTIVSGSGTNEVTVEVGSNVGTIQVVATNTCGSVGPVSENITLTLRPSVNVTGSATICENASHQITSASAANGTLQWTSNGNGVITNSTSLSPTYTPDHSDAGNEVILTLNVTGQNACNSVNVQDSFELHIDNLPNANAGVDGVICQNSTHTQLAANAEYGAVSWSVATGHGSLQNPSSLNPTYHPHINDAGTTVQVNMTVMSNNVCAPQVATDSYEIQIDALPTASVSGNASVCENGTYQITSANAANGNIQWTHDGHGSVTYPNTITPIYNADEDDAGSTVNMAIVVTSNNSCAIQTEPLYFSIDVDRLPQVNISGADQICQNETAQIIGATYDYGNIAWSHNGFGNFDDNTAVSPQYTPDQQDAGSLVECLLTVQSNNACFPQYVEDAYYLAIDPLPYASVDNGGSICETNNYTITSAVAENGNIQWTHNGNGSMTDALSLNPTYIPSHLDAGQTLSLDLIVTSNNACSDQAMTATYQLSVDPLPNVNISEAETTICLLDTMQIDELDFDGGILSWTHNGNGTINNPSAEFPIYYSDLEDENSSILFNVIVESDNACAPAQASDNYSLFVSERPSAALLNDNEISICQGDSYQIIANANNSTHINVYTDANAGILLGQTPLMVTPNETTSYFVEAVGANGCVQIENRDEITISVNPLPDEAIVSQTQVDICYGSAYEITASAENADSFNVYSQQDNGEFLGQTPLMVSPEESTSYFVESVNESGCTQSQERAEISITVNQLPENAVPAVHSIAICEGDDFEIDASAVGADKIFVYTDEFSGTAIGQVPLLVSPSESTTYYLEAVSVHGCIQAGARAEIVVTVNPAPFQVSLIDEVASICQGNGFEITAIENGIDSFNVYTQAENGMLIGQTPLMVYPDEDTVFYVEAVSPEGCSQIENRAEIEIIINPAANVAQLSESAVDICAGDNYLITATSNNADHINVYSQAIGGELLGQTPLMVNPTENTSYFVEAVTTEDCTQLEERNELSINVNFPPELPVLPETNVSICFGDSYEIAPNDVSNVQFYVYDEAIAGNEIGEAPLLITPEETSNYYVEAVSENACGNSESRTVIKVTVLPLPNLSVNVNDTVISAGSYLELLATGGDNYTWSPFERLSCSDCDNPVFSAPVFLNANDEYQLFVTAYLNNCQASDTVVIHVLDDFEIEIPGAFSPNSDGIDDNWVINGLNAFPNAEIVIVNRWGSEVFYAKPYTEYWNGENKNGKKLPSATYFYILKLNDTYNSVYKGNVFLNY